MSVLYGLNRSLEYCPFLLAALRLMIVDVVIRFHRHPLTTTTLEDLVNSASKEHPSYTMTIEERSRLARQRVAGGSPENRSQKAIGA